MANWVSTELEMSLRISKIARKNMNGCKQHLIGTSCSESEELNEACGVFGCVLTDNAGTDGRARLGGVVIEALQGLQHRGQQSAGVVTYDDAGSGSWRQHKGHGLISTVFADPAVAARLVGVAAIGHNRYSTFGGASEHSNIQPQVVHTAAGTIALAHNGEIINSALLRSKFMREGLGMFTSSDIELLSQTLARASAQQLQVKNKRKALRLTKPSSGGASTNGFTCGDGPLVKHNGAVDQDLYGGDEWTLKIKRLMSFIPLSYSLVVLQEGNIYAARDRFGNRPLCMGRIVSTRIAADGFDVQRSNSSGGVSSLKNSDVLGWVACSESSVFQAIGAEFIREILPGEIVRITKHGFSVRDRLLPPTLHSLSTSSLAEAAGHSVAGDAAVRRVDPSCRCENGDAAEHDAESGAVNRCRAVERQKTALCVFEYVYFARSESYLEGQQVYTVRVKCGEQLAFETGDSVQTADLVAAVPESANAAAHGFAQQAKIPFLDILTRNRYAGRSFILPSTDKRRGAITRKFGLLEGNIRGKRIILVDDSIVRGNTMSILIQMFRECGAAQVHIRIASPPLRHPCYMGINIPDRKDLVANEFVDEDLLSPETNRQVAMKVFGADSLRFLTIDGLLRAIEGGMQNTDEADKHWGLRGHCVACLTGDYPVDPHVVSTSPDIEDL